MSEAASKFTILIVRLLTIAVQHPCNRQVDVLAVVVNSFASSQTEENGLVYQSRDPDPERPVWDLRWSHKVRWVWKAATMKWTYVADAHIEHWVPSIPLYNTIAVSITFQTS